LFTTLIVQPIFNLLVLIYNIIPGHNFGLAIILFTIVVRILLWPFVKQQLHQTKLMRKLQPEIKEIKKKAKGDKRQESVMMMELYKERGVSMFASFRMLLIQLPILFGLYIGLRKVLDNPQELVAFSYPWLQDFSWMQELAKNIGRFDETLLGLINLTRPALGPGGVYWPAMLLVAGSAAIQFVQSKQLLPQDKDARSLRQILKDAGKGRQADQTEVNAAVGKNTIFLFPALIFLFTVNLPSALSLYWLVSGMVAFIQQSIALREDVDEMEELADKSDKRAIKNKAPTLPQAADSSKRRFGSKTSRARAGEGVDGTGPKLSAAEREKQAVEAEVVSVSPKVKSKGKKRRK
jgi:YidC/Oxa1 family membrane protein insertase